MTPNRTPIFEIPQNVFECVNAYKHRCESKDFSIIQSSIFRFTLPGLGMAFPKGDRLTQDEIAAARDFLKTLPLSALGKFVEAQEKTFQILNVSKDVQRRQRNNLRKFLHWVADQSWVNKTQLETGEEFYRFSGERHERIERKRLTNRPISIYKRFSLSFDVNDYSSDSDELNKNQTQADLTRIKSELNDLEAHMKYKGYRPYTIQVRIKGIERFLGWLYYYKHIPLQELSLKSLIPVVKLKFSLADFSNYHDYVYAKGLAQEKVRDIAELVLKNIDEFFQWLNNPPSSSTKAIYTETVITIAKYLYRNETDVNYAIECQDIPLVRRLRVYCNKFEEQRRSANNTVVPFHEKAVSWEQVLMVLEKLRYEATATHTYDTARFPSGKFKKKIRPIKAIAASFMKFLLLSMFTLMPPDRQRTFRELKLGETLKHGVFKGELFIPKEKMLNPNQAKYFIHLLPEDYKTGDSYGEWVGEIPDTKFSDGSTFYQYLNKWLYNPIETDNGTVKGLRNVLNPKNHNYVFFGRITGEPLDVVTLTSKVQHFFERHTKIPVTPHTLRKIFRTYVKEKGISLQEEESIAFWMKHDLRTANKDYTFLTCQSKLKAGLLLADRVNTSILEKVKLSANDPENLAEEPDED